MAAPAYSLRISPRRKGLDRDMYAIIRSGGKQARVAAGDILDVELLQDAAGSQVTFTPLLVVDDRGTAVSAKQDLDRLSVTARVVGQVKGRKVDIFKYKNKSGYRRRQGHRQRYTRLEILEIGAAHSREV